MKALFILVLFFSVFFEPILYSQIKNFGLPYIQNYPISKIPNESEILNIGQDENGIMYFVGDNGFFSYDGKNWKNHKTEKNIKLHSILVHNNIIYVGGMGEIGYFSNSFFGELIYKSLNDLVPEKYRDFNDIWEIHIINDTILFCSYEYLFYFADNKITCLAPPVSDEKFQCWNVVNNTMFCNRIKHDWEKISPDKNLIPLSKKTNLISGGFRDVYEYGSDTLLAISSKNIMLFTDDSLFELPLVDFGKIESEIAIYSSLKLEKGWAIGTYNKGLIIIDNKGKVLQHLDKEKGLIGDCIYSLFLDLNKNLWVCCSNGISVVQLNSPYTFIDNRMGLPEAKALHISQFNSKLYVGTRNGIFYTEFETYKNPLVNPFNFKFTGKFSNMSWDSFVHDNLLFVAGGYKNVIIIDSLNNIEKLHWQYITQLSSSNFNPDIIWGCGWYGIFKIVKKNDKWQFETQIQGYDKRCERVFQINNRELIISYNEDQILKCTLNDSLDSIVAIKKYTINDGLLTNYNNLMFCDKDEIIVSSKLGLLQLNKVKDIFEPHLFNSINFLKNSKIIDYETSNNNYFLTTNNSIVEIDSKNKTKNYNFLSNKNIHSVKIIDNSNTLFLTNNGFIHYDKKYDSDNEYFFNTIIRKIECKSDTFRTIWNGFALNHDSLLINKTAILTYSENNLRFTYSSPFFIDNEAIVFQFILEGFDKSWSEWITNDEKEYTNIPEGKYTFKVKAKNIYDTEGSIATYSFKILPPWYRTWWAYILYIGLGIALIIFIVKLNTRRLIEAKKKLEIIVKLRTAEIEQQKEEILSQNEEILTQKEKIEIAFYNIRELSEIGKQITSSLSVETIITTVYKNINNLLDATVFEIGIIENNNEKLLFPCTIEKGERFPPYTESLNDDKLSAVCYNAQKVIVINDIEKEYNLYLNGTLKIDIGEIPSSLIYLPLTNNNNKIGVISVQSFKSYSYTDVHIDLLKSISIYVAIALENANIYDEINNHKEIIEEINKNLFDSINYAKLIQNAVLPSNDFLKKLTNESFILFRPKDIVSGDFYYVVKVNQYLVYAVADCTGHGVPGAFMSMLGVSFLNEIVRKKEVTQANHILTHLRQSIIESLKQTKEHESQKDGMDMSLAVINIENEHLQWAGANNPLWIVRSRQSLIDNHQSSIDNLIEFKPDKMPIAIYERMNDFTNHEIQLNSGDLLYLMSDGYEDQFGGPKHKKFLSKNLKQLLIDNSQLTMEEQKQVLEKTLVEWIGEGEQIDDITVMGIKI